LVGSDIDEWRDQQDIRPFAGDERERGAVNGDGLLDGQERAGKEPVAGAIAKYPPLHQPPHQRGGLGAGSVSQAADLGVLGREIPDVVDRVTGAARESQPEAPGDLALDLAGGDARVGAGQFPQQPVVAFLVLLGEHQVHAVAALAQRAERRGEVPQRSGVPHGKQDLHGVAPSKNTTRT
jgi:hypothetical protein